MTSLRKRLAQMWKNKFENKEESEPLDQSHLGKTLHSQPAFAHTLPHSTIHGGGQGLLEILPTRKCKPAEIKEYDFGR